MGPMTFEKDGIGLCHCILEQFCPNGGLMEKYGEDKCQMIMQMMYGNYTHFGLLNTGLYNLEKTKKVLEPLANCVNVEFKEMKAPFGVLKKMCALELDDPNFVIVPPGTAVTEAMLEPEK